MGVLTRDAILAEIGAGRLIIDPYSADQVGPASIDLTLGDEIRVIEPGLEAIPISADVDYRNFTRHRRLDAPFVLDPASLTLPPDLCGFLEGRSRFARLGLMIHVTSAFVQPGVSNHQVLEISNVSGRPLEIHPGTRLCQIVLFRTEGEAVYRGRFADQSEL
jgi:dCTP deaminase